MRAFHFIEQSADRPTNFAVDGSDYLYCFLSIANTARDPQLRAEALQEGRDKAAKWAARNAKVPANTNVDALSDQIFGWYAAAQLGQSDQRIKPELEKAAARFSTLDYLLFDPAKEPPPADIPERCEYDSVENPRGARFCKRCHRPLAMRSKYSIWLDALITTYTGDRYGITLGRPFRDVLQWSPAMRPYLERSKTRRQYYYDNVYALTHLVYTVNDYGTYLVPPALLPKEFAYLRRNLPEAMALADPETMGEFLDSLKSFGLTDADPEVRTGVTYLMDTQRSDGTWGPTNEKDSYTLYHAAWTGIDGLKEANWRGQGLSFPELRPLLQKMAAEK